MQYYFFPVLEQADNSGPIKSQIKSIFGSRAIVILWGAIFLLRLMQIKDLHQSECQ